ALGTTERANRNIRIQSAFGHNDAHP
ncbi:hypothetical protein D046_3028, partial [Vibrio parahaemolyticus V-223/04]